MVGKWGWGGTYTCSGSPFITPPCISLWTHSSFGAHWTGVRGQGYYVAVSYVDLCPLRRPVGLCLDVMRMPVSRLGGGAFNLPQLVLSLLGGKARIGEAAPRQVASRLGGRVTR